MSSISTTHLLDDWQTLKVDWEIINQPKRQAFQIKAGTAEIVPTEKHLFRGEGILQDFSASFDSPLCGIRIRDGNAFDSKESWIIRDFMAIQYPTSEDFGLYVVTPPYTPYGIYYVHRAKDWYWLDWLELALINTDTADHWVLGYGYQIAISRQPSRREELYESKLK